MAKVIKNSILFDDWENGLGITERNVVLNLKVQFRSDDELMKIFNIYEELKLNLNKIKSF